MESMLGFDQVLIESGFDPADFLKALHDEVRRGFKLSSTPGGVHTFRGLIMPGIVRAGLVSERVRSRYEQAEIRVSSDTRILEQFERTAELAPN
jgi:hypothetical protein